MAKGGYVYLMASPNRGSVYVGMTSDIKKRVWEHKNKVYPECYTARYNCVVLVYYKEFYEVTEAIVEEKRIKKRNRPAKERLIDSINPDWEDLYGEVLHKF